MAKGDVKKAVETGVKAVEKEIVEEVTETKVSLLAKLKAISNNTWWKVGGITLVVLGTAILAFMNVSAGSISAIVVSVVTLIGLVIALLKS